jgi:hypothetical protein
LRAPGAIPVSAGLRVGTALRAALLDALPDGVPDGLARPLAGGRGQVGAIAVPRDGAIAAAGIVVPRALPTDSRRMLRDAVARVRAGTFMLAQGFAVVGRRIARTGLDFARAVADGGIEHTIDGLDRYIVHERAGQANLTTHAGMIAR